MGLNVLDGRALALLQEGNLTEAEASFRTLLQHHESRSADSAAFAMCLNSLASVHLRQNRMAEACAELEQATLVRERAHATAPSARGELELGMLKRNLASAQRMAGTSMPSTSRPSAPSCAPSSAPSSAPNQRGSPAAANDQLHQLSRDELQVPCIGSLRSCTRHTTTTLATGHLLTTDHSSCRWQLDDLQSRPTGRLTTSLKAFGMPQEGET